MEHNHGVAYSNILDEAMGSIVGRVVVLEDSVETSAAFLLHHLIKRFLFAYSRSVVIFIAFAHPFIHYDRILKKLGCNLVVQRDNNRFLFFDMFASDGVQGESVENKLAVLYAKILKAISGLPQESKSYITVIIDDVSLMEVAAKGSTNHVLDFVHYCHTLTSEFGCSLVMLNHHDIYSCIERPILILQMEHLASILIKAEPLVTGLAKDVHGQLTVLNRGTLDGQVRSRNKTCTFHFKIKENGVDYFFPGSKT